MKRSTLRSSCGEALLRVRISQPASGKSRCACFCNAVTARVAGIGLRQAQPVLPAHQAAGLQQPGGAQRRFAHQHARPEAEAAGDLVRLALQRCAQFDRDIADGDAVADFQIEPRQQL